MRRSLSPIAGIVLAGVFWVLPVPNAASARCVDVIPVDGCTSHQPACNGGSCSSYSACPCNETCGGEGIYRNCTYRPIVRKKYVYTRGFSNAQGCCSGGQLKLNPDGSPALSTETCSYTKAYRGFLCRHALTGPF